MTDAITNATLRQKEASHPAHSVWVSANAGTGKTHVLTQRIVRLLLADDTLMPHEILAMTYTNAAASEMRSRVRSTLAKLAVLNDEKLVEELQKMDVPASAAGRARNLFNVLNESAEDLSVSTIHGFCQRFLRRFPLEAGVPTNFSVLEEQEQKDLLKQSFEKAIHSAAASPMWHYRFFVGHLGDKNLKEALDGFVKNSSDYIHLFLEQGGLSGVVEKVAQQLSVSAESTPQSLPDITQKMWPSEQTITQLQEDLPLISGAGNRPVDYIMAPLQTALKAQDAAQYRKAFLKADGTFMNLGWALTKAAQTAAPNLLNLLEAEQQRLMELETQRRNLKTFLMTCAYLNMGAKMLEIYASLKHKRAVLDYDDLIIKTKNLLADETQNAWVIYRMDSQIKHVMLDEGQDTDRHQWHIIEALVNEFYSTKPNPPRTLFAVGDIKQSIYGFRGAQPAVFKNIFPYINQFSKTHTSSDISMNVSFRSAPVILDFVDKIFTQKTAQLGEENISHAAAHSARGGRVTVWPLVKKEPQEKEKIEGWKLPPENPNEPLPNSPARTLAEHVAGETFKLISSPLSLDCRNGKAIEPEDIMVLVRNRTAAAEIIAAFNRAGVPHTGFDRLKFADDPMIADIINTLHFLAHKDDYSLALTLRSTLFGWRDEDLMALRTQNLNQPLWQALQAQGGAAATTLKNLLRYVDYDGVYALTLRLLQATKARGKFLCQYGHGHSSASTLNDILDAFLGTLIGAPDLLTFLHNFRTESFEGKRALENAKGAVRIMSAHSAKGLQAPIVFLPDTTNPYVSSQKDSVAWREDEAHVKQFCLYRMNKAEASPLQQKIEEEEAQKAEENELRLLYVAMTRAEEMLYIGGAEKSKGDCWYKHIESTLQAENKWDETGFIAQTPTSTPAMESIEDKAENEALLPAWVGSTPAQSTAPSQSVTGLRQQELRLEGSQMRFGQVVHKALENIPEGRAPKAQTLEEKEAAAVAQKVMETFPELFNAQSAAEVPVAAVVDGQPLHGVVDRLVVMDSEVWVIDYKSEKNMPAEVPEAYAEQMRGYQKIVQQIFPNHTVKTALLWVRAAPAPALQWLS